jgi:hypothetical protein
MKYKPLTMDEAEDFISRAAWTSAKSTEDVAPHQYVVRGWDRDDVNEEELEPVEFIDRGEYLIVPYRFGGRARHTGLEVEFSFVHLITLHDGKVTRLEVHRTKAEALEAAGLRE